MRSLSKDNRGNVNSAWRAGSAVIGLVVIIWVVGLVVNSLRTSIGTSATAGSMQINDANNFFYETYNFLGLTTVSGGSGLLEIIGILLAVGILIGIIKRYGGKM